MAAGEASVDICSLLGLLDLAVVCVASRGVLAGWGSVPAGMVAEGPCSLEFRDKGAIIPLLFSVFLHPRFGR